MRYPEVPEAIRSEIAAGLVRLGVDKDARLRWLQDFIARDLGTKEARDRTLQEVFVFAVATRFGASERRGPIGVEQLSPKVFNRRHVRDGAAIRRAQKEVADAFRSFAATQRCELRFSIVGWERLPDGRVLPVVGGDLWSWFYGAIFALLAELGSDLGVCVNPQCCKLFIRSGRQAYCDPRCSQRQRTQRFRETNPERVRELRHESHKRKQRQRLGPRVRVERRPRRSGDRPQ